MLALCEHWWRTACEADLHACIASFPEPKTTGHVYLVTPGRGPGSLVGLKDLSDSGHSPRTP